MKVKVIMGDHDVIVQMSKGEYYDIKRALRHYNNAYTLDLLKKLEKEEK
jgi:hypothetical protein